jgi:isoquinoline 1-oxidoreductase beta subunit
MISLSVNGHSHRVHTPPEKPLLWVLRDELHLKGTKYGCGVGICGICTVLIDTEPQHACMVPIGKLGDRAVTTVEGLVEAKHPVVQAWIEAQVPQCGYCQPGQIMAALALLERSPHPNVGEIERALSGVLCRCGTYQRIGQALRLTTEIQRNSSRRSNPELLPPSHLDKAISVSAEECREEKGADLVVLNPWVSLSTDGSVTVVIDRSEMGQGVATAFAMLVAEELEVELSRVRMAFAPADPIYNNPVFDEQLTGGSTSVRGEWERMRRAGASARAVLIGAAAARWGVSEGECYAHRGAVYHERTGQRLEYTALLAEAARRSPPEHPPLKLSSASRVVGRPTPRLDIPAMVAGRARYSIDIARSRQLAATVARPPVFSGRVIHFDATRALAVPGVRRVLAIDTGIAVVADDYWSALRGRELLDIEFEPGVHSGVSNVVIDNQLQQAALEKGEVIRQEGQPQHALSEAAQIMEACYQTPYLAHASLEPMNCTAEVASESCDVWVGTQSQSDVWATVAQLTGLPRARIRVHTTFLGGGFGRRLETDFVAETVQIAKAMRVPVQLIWTRQDDFQHDRYRPAHCAFLKAGFDPQGKPESWFLRVAGSALALNGIDVPYDIPNIGEEHVRVTSAVPTGPWRSVGASQNAFVVECFIDEMAYAAGRDPLAFRLEHLRYSPHHQTVLELAAARAGWGRPLPVGHYHGLAVYYSFRSWVAMVAEISITSHRQIRVHGMTAAIDCGRVINPDTVCAQIEGAVAFGLSATLKEALRVEHGAVQQKSFADYPILTFAEMPRVEVHIVPSEAPPGGVGEPGVPPVAPAVANAVFAATGHRLRALPLRLNGAPV